VVDGDRLIGIVSVTDILRAKVRDDALIAQDVRTLLLAHADDRSCWDVIVHDGIVTLSSCLPDQKQQVLRLLAETVPGVVRVRAAHPNLAAPAHDSGRTLPGPA